MLITCKTISNDNFKVTAKPSSTILDLKQIIGTVRDIDPTMIKIILNGNILKDDHTIEDSKITEANFIVVLVQKKVKITDCNFFCFIF